jgi:putative ABC transport system permease protein
VTQRDIELASREVTMTNTAEANTETEEQRQERTNRNQLDRIIVRVSNTDHVPAVADVTRRLLTRRHNTVVDFEITVPELLLKQEQRTKSIFNIVLGATRNEILFQFLSEAVLISVVGGVAGILLGVGLSLGIEQMAGITTIVSYLSVVIAFGVSFAVGLGFGIVPAYRAAQQDPVTCLRYE